MHTCIASIKELSVICIFSSQGLRYRYITCSLGFCIYKQIKTEFHILYFHACQTRLPNDLFAEMT